MRRKPRQFPVFYYNDMFLTGTGGANKALNNQQEGFAMQNEDFYEVLDMRKQEQLPIVLTPAEAMDVLGVGKNTMYWLLNSGQLPAVRIGRSWKISLDAIHQFIG